MPFTSDILELATNLTICTVCILGVGYRSLRWPAVLLLASSLLALVFRGQILVHRIQRIHGASVPIPHTLAMVNRAIIVSSGILELVAAAWALALLTRGDFPIRKRT